MIINNNLINRCLNWAGKTLHAPEQRILIGATGLAIQPFIDLNNKNVDKETRKISAWRTAAKIIAGTIVGVAVRYWGIAFVKKFAQYDTVVRNGLVEQVIPKKGRGFFVPMLTKSLKPGQSSILPIAEDALKKRFDKYIKSMGTFVATIAMIGTNFLCDAPATKWLTEKFLNFQKKLDARKSGEVKK